MRVSDFAGLVDLEQSLLLVYPDRKMRPLPDKGARYHSMLQLREFFSRLVYQRTNAKGTQAFQVPKDHIHIYQPDNVAEDPIKMGISFVPGSYSYDEKWVYALGELEAEEETIDKYAPGTVIFTLGYYVEDFTVQSWATKYATVRALNEGNRHAMRVMASNGGNGQLQLNCPDYYDQVACFQIISGPGYSPDLVSEVQGKRMAELQVELWVPEVALLDYRHMRVILDFGPGEKYIRDGNVYPTLEG